MSPGATVLNITREGNAQSVFLSILAVSARGRIGPCIVVFVALTEILVTSPKLVDHLSLVVALAHPQGSPAQLPTPIKVDHLLYFLSGHTNSIVEFLSAGFTHGFPLHFEGSQVSSSAPNLSPTLRNPEVVDAKLNKELAAHRLAGPFFSPLFQCFGSLHWVWRSRSLLGNSV